MQTLLKLDAIKARMKAASDALRVSAGHFYLIINNSVDIHNCNWNYILPKGALGPA